MELRLTPNQQKGVTLVQDIARAAGMNIYLTGGAVRDIISGFPIRDLDFTVQGNPLKLQKDLERAGAVIGGSDDDFHVVYCHLARRSARRDQQRPDRSAMKRPVSLRSLLRPRLLKTCGGVTSR